MSEGERVYSSGGKEYGLTTGEPKPCTLSGCGGLKLGVRWPGGKITYPCTDGMHRRADGCWQIGTRKE